MTARRAAYVPEAGDVVWLEFDPQAGHQQAGHQQAGRRPAVVLSLSSDVGRTGLAVVCPVTTRIKGHPIEVAPAGDPTSVALADQVKSFDWRVRRATFKARATASELREMRGKLGALIG